MALGSYFSGFAKAAFPIVWRWMLPTLSGMRITNPRDSSTVESDWVEVSGTYRFDLGLRFVLFHQIGHEFYPQGIPVLNVSRHEWNKEVHIGSDTNKEHKIVLAALNDDVYTVVDYYSHLAEAKKIYHAIPLHKIPQGMTVLQTVAVKVKRPAGG